MFVKWPYVLAVAWSSLPRHWFLHKEPESPGSPPVAGALQFLFHPLPRCCRACHAYFLCDGASHWFPLSGTEKPCIRQRGMRGFFLAGAAIVAVALVALSFTIGWRISLSRRHSVRDDLVA